MPLVYRFELPAFLDELASVLDFGGVLVEN